MSTSKAREESNGTHMTESPALEEVERSPRVVTARATGATLKMLSSKAMKFPKDPPSRRSKLKVKFPRLKKTRPRKKLLKKKSPDVKNSLIPKRKLTKASLLSRNSLLKRRRSILRRKSDNTKKSRRLMLKNSREKVTTELKANSALLSKTSCTQLVLPRLRTLIFLDSKLVKMNSSLENQEVEEAAEAAVAAEVVPEVADPMLLKPKEEETEARTR